MSNSVCKELGIASFMNDEYGSMWKVAVVAYSNPEICQMGLENNHELLFHGSP
jgi:hypothetical protein